MVRRRGSRGFTMLEAAASLAVLCVVATTVTVVSSSHLRYLARSHEETAAYRRAAAQLERVRAQKDRPQEGVTSFDVANVAFAGSQTGTQRVTQIAAGLWRVEVDLDWQGSDGGTARAHLATLVAREAGR